MAKKEKLTVPEGVTPHCMNCKRCGQLMQWGENPVIAHCTMSGERQVARRTMCRYWLFDADYNNKPITQMRK